MGTEKERLEILSSRHADKFTAAVHALVKQRVDAGKTEQVQPLEDGPASVASNVLDFTDLLQRSWGSRKAAKPQAAAPFA